MNLGSIFSSKWMTQLGLSIGEFLGVKQLSDYQEINGTITADVPLAYGNFAAIKIGSLVICKVSFRIDAPNGNTNDAALYGLPFTAEYNWGGFHNYRNGGYDSVGFYVADGTTEVVIHAGSGLPVDYEYLEGSGAWDFTVVYRTSD